MQPGRVITVGMAEDSFNQRSSEQKDQSDPDENTPLLTGPINNDEDKFSGSVRCDCHEPIKPADKASRNRLIIASILVLLFMIGEVIG